ncbi:uncharacterized protein RSE6_10695 [Rhynchosporium secalis]|uniref:Uncharacterized protein n=1 Tax=Rhynchosporium secalis TaxID=38038 RepID=A0A1E1ML33_RHYSE|nr:uncharacterized protein RSE6_10695 [Rhynchosporium secalis]
MSTEHIPDGLRIKPIEERTLKEFEAVTPIELSPYTLHTEGDTPQGSPTSIWSASPISYLVTNHNLPPSLAASRTTSPDLSGPSAPPPTPITPTYPRTAYPPLTNVTMPEHPPCLRVQDPAFLSKFFTSMSSSEESIPAWAQSEAESQQREENYAWVNSKVEEMKDEFAIQICSLRDDLVSQIGLLRELIQDHATSSKHVHEAILNGISRLDGEQKNMVDAQDKQANLLSTVYGPERDLPKVLRQLDLLIEIQQKKGHWIASPRNRGVRYAKRNSAAVPGNMVRTKRTPTLQSAKSALYDPEISKSENANARDELIGCDEASSEDAGDVFYDCLAVEGYLEIPGLEHLMMQGADKAE